RGRGRRTIQAAAGRACRDPARQGRAGRSRAGRATGTDPMNVSAPFIYRPIATALLMVALLVGGLVAYPLLPVAALPNVNYPPLIRKVNPADTPILVLGITSDSLPLTDVDAYAQNILLQKISQVSGVGLVGVGGTQQPTVRIQVDPQALAARGINLEDVRTV